MPPAVGFDRDGCASETAWPYVTKDEWCGSWQDHALCGHYSMPGNCAVSACKNHKQADG